MVKAIRLTSIGDVRFGQPGTVKIAAKEADGSDITIIINLTHIRSLAPCLLQAASAAFLAPEMPEEGLVPETSVPVADAKVFTVNDTQEPGLTLYTPAGTFSFRIPTNVAESSGKDLVSNALALTTPGQG